MFWPSWNADTAAAVQALAAIAQGGLTVVALFVAIAVPWWQQRQARAEDRARRAAEIAGLRHALHTEVSMIGQQCLIELDSWIMAGRPPIGQKNLRTSKLPRLAIYEANANRIGLLSREEIVELSGFFGTLRDISEVVADMEGRPAQQNDWQVLVLLFSNACGHAARFLEAVPGIDKAEEDRPFIERLRLGHSSMDSARSAAAARMMPPAVRPPVIS